MLTGCYLVKDNQQQRSRKFYNSVFHSKTKKKVTGCLQETTCYYRYVSLKNVLSVGALPLQNDAMDMPGHSERL